MFISDRFKDLEKEFKHNKNSHSYMFYTNDFFSCQKDVYELIKGIFKKNLNLLETDLVIIKKSDKKNILKEDMLNLKNIFKTTSYLNNKRVYLVEEAHKLNATSSNMILKFLEEPMEGVIALFITDNLDSVLNTIKSRCQIINVFYSVETQTKISEEVAKLDKLLFNNDKYVSLITAKKELESFDRNDLIQIIKQDLELYYNKELTKEVIQRIKKLNAAITLLNKNVNIDYVIDYVLLKDSD